MKQLLLTRSILFSLILPSVTFACSNIGVVGQPGIAAVARTMDMELNTGNTFGFGAKGWHNRSNINMPQMAPIHAARWVNKYPFLGQSAFKTYVITDGINNQGLYAAYLDLPDISYYPSYNPKDKRPELGMTDVINFVLGTSRSVPEAINKLKKMQIVKNAFEIKYKKHFYFGGNAVHLVLRDKEGNVGVIEWVKFKGSAYTHYYLHKTGTHTVVETIDGANIQPVVFKNTDAAVVTNSPDYAWQLRNTSHYDYVFTGSTGRKWDGIYMNGSGFFGVHGDWTPPSRFTRGAQLERLMPRPETEKEALALAYSAIQTMRVPVGANPSSSIWMTVSDLKNSVYYFKPLLNVYPKMKNHMLYISVPAFNATWQHYSVNAIAGHKHLPQGWVSTRVQLGKMATPQQTEQSLKMSYTPTPGNVRYHYAWKSDLKK